MDLRITPVDDKKVEEGTWTKYRGVDVKIARAGNTEYARIFAQLTRPYKRDIERGTLDEKTMKSILCETLAKTVLVDWDNFEIDGAKIEYDFKKAKQLLENDPDCRDHIQEFARDLDNFIKEDIEEVVEKSEES